MHGSKFAALIPGDGVAEQVITSGLSSFLCAPRLTPGTTPQ